jgi:uncharacterized protein
LRPNKKAMALALILAHCSATTGGKSEGAPMPFHQSANTKRPLLVATLAACVGLLAVGPKAQAEEHAVKRTVTVSATGEVSAVPDVARVSAGVVTEAATAGRALDQNSAAMSALIKALKAEGIASEDLQTSNFSVSPRYNRPERGEIAEITGYQVRNQVDVTVRKLDTLGVLLDLLITRGANSVHGPTFEVSKMDALKDEARKTAMARAKRRAKLLAGEAGAELGKVMTIAEDVHGPTPGRPMMARAAMREAVPIEAGSETLSVRVTVSWQIK